jgi:translin
MPSPDLGSIEEVARAELDDKFAAREIGVVNSRRIIRSSANAIRALHRGETERANELMDEAGTILDESAGALAGHKDIFHAGFFHDAAKEYAEARTTAALIREEPLPLPADLGVPVASYLNGLGEAVGELRRRMLDLLRAGHLADAESVFESMETIQGLLASLDYPDAMTGGLRRTTDVARALIERSRADLTSTIVQERLRRELAGRSDG